jgi:predicted regulator of Ras-like GTPase activity (Roadblock/LC7/MglB family)
MDPRHVGAHKGLGFLFYSQGNLDASLDHLELALSIDPTNQSIIQAWRAVRNAAEEVTEEHPIPSQPPAELFTPPSTGAGETSVPFAEFESGDHGMLLVDLQGRVLAGELETPVGALGSAEAAAHLAGVSQEMERTARMLQMGEWRWLVVEAADGNVHLTQPAEDTILFIVRDRSVPAGRLGMLAETAGAKARAWLDGHRA